MADGETYDEAIKNAQIVINEWIETAIALNCTIPIPKNRLTFA
jgi:predicted RNase H-like HicB family nuclease